MPMPNQLKEFDVPVVISSAATLNAGFTVTFAAPTRGEIIGLYATTIDGTTITGTGPGIFTFTVGNVAGATASLVLTGIAAGQAAGGYAVFSARQFCNDGDMVKIVLTGAGITNAVNAVLTVVIRARSI